MSRFTKLALKAAIVGLVLGGGYQWVKQSPERVEATASTTSAVVEKTLDNTEVLIDKSNEVVEEAMVVVSDAWDRVDIKGEVDNLQDEVKPIGDAIKKTVDPKKIPGVKAAGWLDNKTSLPAILLFLIAGVTLFLVAFAGPSSLSGGRD